MPARLISSAVFLRAPVPSVWVPDTVCEERFPRWWPNPRGVIACWRGRSGRRYAVVIGGLTTERAIEAMPHVLVAVARDGREARIVDLASGLGHPGLARQWIERARAAAATELHVHHGAVSAKARTRVVQDLTVDPDAVAA